MRKQIMVFMVVFVSVIGCKKDPLEAPYNQIEGRFQWEYTSYREDMWSSTQIYIWANQSDMSAEIEFTNKEKVIFYIDGKEIASDSYKVLSKNHSDNSFEIRMKVKVKKDILDINDELHISMHGTDSLYVGKFPYNSYKVINSHNHTNLFIRK